MRAWSREHTRAGRRVGLVPTMGFLHEGHLRLIDRARDASDQVVVSVFVNPLQFGPGEDFGRYPRDLPRDRSLAEGRGADCLFVPGPEAVYPEPPVIRLLPGAMGDHLCGPWRPGHFAGVLTVVAKLFALAQPARAYFGRKDFQQATLVRRLVHDLNHRLRRRTDTADECRTPLPQPFVERLACRRDVAGVDHRAGDPWASN